MNTTHPTTYADAEFARALAEVLRGHGANPSVLPLVDDDEKRRQGLPAYWLGQRWRVDLPGLPPETLLLTGPKHGITFVDDGVPTIFYADAVLPARLALQRRRAAPSQEQTADPSRLAWQLATLLRSRALRVRDHRLPMSGGHRVVVDGWDGQVIVNPASIELHYPDRTLQCFGDGFEEAAEWICRLVAPSRMLDADVLALGDGREELAASLGVVPIALPDHLPPPMAADVRRLLTAEHVPLALRHRCVVRHTSDGHDFWRGLRDGLMRMAEVVDFRKPHLVDVYLRYCVTVPVPVDEVRRWHRDLADATEAVAAREWLKQARIHPEWVELLRDPSTTGRLAETAFSEIIQAQRLEDHRPEYQDT